MAKIINLNQLDKNTYQVYGAINGIVYNENQNSIGKNFESWKYKLKYFDKSKCLIKLSGGGAVYRHIEDVMKKLQKIYDEEIA